MPKYSVSPDNRKKDEMEFDEYLMLQGGTLSANCDYEDEVDDVFDNIRTKVGKLLKQRDLRISALEAKTGGMDDSSPGSSNPDYYDRSNLMSPPSPKKSPKKKSPKKCPPGKVLNPKTNRCIKPKKSPKKKSPKKSPKKKSPKKCPPGKVLNPKTNRCNKAKTSKKTKKPTPVGEFKEIVAPQSPKVSSTLTLPSSTVYTPKKKRGRPKKSVKKSPPKTKVCPPGKVLNPKTNRCKKKTPSPKKREFLMNWAEMDGPPLPDNRVIRNSSGSSSGPAWND